jgi:hypothetical protein
MSSTINDWQTEVEIERDRLIQAGESPWRAAQLAAQNVGDRRAKEAMFPECRIASCTVEDEL